MIMVGHTAAIVRGRFRSSRGVVVLVSCLSGLVVGRGRLVVGRDALRVVVGGGRLGRRIRVGVH